MSSRALRKLGGKSLEDELKRLDIDVSPEEDVADKSVSEDDDQPAINPPKFNAFAFLDGNDEVSDNDDEDEVETQNDSKPADTTKRIESSTPPTSKRKSKKKKKAKNKSRSSTPAQETEDDEEEDIDKILAEVKRKEQVAKPSPKTTLESYDFEEEYDSTLEPCVVYDSNFKNFTTERLKRSLPLLSIKSFKNLDQDQEYKNLFGNSLSTELIEDANSTTSLAISPELLQQFKKLGKMIRNWGGKDRRSIPGTSRKLLLSKIRDDWLPTQLKSVSMEELGEDEVFELLRYKESDVDDSDLRTKVSKERNLGVRYFRFNKVNDTKNRVANTRFYASTVLTPDPESLMHLLQQNPYHQETLLQVAMVLLRQGDNKATSNALIERALFTFDRSFHKKFHELVSSAENGLVRLPYEFFSNRQFHLNLFRYIVSLGERSLFETALTYCKFLLSLSPADDPMGVRYFIDFYCIMSEEFGYLIQLAESPLVTCYTRWYTPGIAFSTVLAYLSLNRVDDAEKEIQKAYEAYPYVAYKLLTDVALSSVPGVKESDFKVTHEVAVSAETYLVRAKLLWQSHLGFLGSSLEKLFKTKHKPNSTSYASSLFGLLSFGARNTDELSNEVPFNLIRFAILSGENKIMAKLPKSIWGRDDLFEFDALPPKEENSQELNIHGGSKRICDSLIDYVDQNLLGAIVQENTRGIEAGLSPEETALLQEALRNVDGHSDGEAEDAD
ncbi:hypothetical protein CANMA_005218 [Candida margitis]|uniref:uncharacterized protein n=1 Tax=Candida margitis TaxID=1775924 RepID=UPI002226AD06|nr:uncharacterized protein CANMA_005218 [Candida margitis]KAI5950558.1 hypothetical protein CANMA_005218 [Candida margitis]